MQAEICVSNSEQQFCTAINASGNIGTREQLATYVHALTY